MAAVGGLPNALRELSDPAAQMAIALSVRTTLWAIAIIAVFGTPLAYWIGRSEALSSRIVEVVCELPLALPPAAAGVALLLAFGRSGWIDLHVSFTEAAVVVAQVFVAAPFFLRASVAAFAQGSPELYDAAQADGANSLARFFLVGVPIGQKALIGGLIIAWARAAGEFGATIIFAGNYPGRTQTMPLAIYLGFQVNFRQALALSLLLMAVAVVGFAAAQWAMRESEA